MAKARPQLDKMANGKKKPMSRTSGVAGRKLGRSEGIATKLKYGAPLTGSASGVKSISLKDAGEVLTSGIVTLGKKGLQADPASLAMALPVGKVLKAGQALKAAGKFGVANQFLGRVAAKKAGQEFSKDLAIAARAAALDEPTRALRKAYRQGGKIFKGRTSRMTSEIEVFPRLPKGNLPPGEKRTFDVLADPFGEGSWRSADGIQPVKNALKTGFAKFSKSVPTKSGINEIKQATAKRGIKVTEQGASKMARLLEERAKRRGK